MSHFRCVSLLVGLSTLVPAMADTYSVGIGDDCGASLGCFYPQIVTLQVGDSVHFYSYAENMWTGDHNVVADDGSFRCARGCEGEGGDATPVGGFTCGGGACSYNAARVLSVTRTFTRPGIVRYHDEVGGATGLIEVKDSRPGAITPAFTGSWYDPSQGGHGLMIEVLPNGRFLAAWLAFTPDGGGQAWFQGVGTYDGSTAVVKAMQPVGGRWLPNFDPRQVTLQSWGSLTFTFSDCTHGKVDFSSIAGYGSGSMSLTRLTQPADLICP